MELKEVLQEAGAWQSLELLTPQSHSQMSLTPVPAASAGKELRETLQEAGATPFSSGLLEGWSWSSEGYIAFEGSPLDVSCCNLQLPCAAVCLQSLHGDQLLSRC